MAVPGSVVGVGKLITPGGQQGPKGDAGTAANVPLADITQDGLLRKTSGNTTDFVDGTNNYQALQPTITALRLRSFSAVGNPNFEVDQHNVGATRLSVPNSGRMVDRWMWGRNGTHQINSQQVSELVNLPGTNFMITRSPLVLTLATAQATLAVGEYGYVFQYVEGSSLRELLNDVSSVSILIKSTKANHKFSYVLVDPTASRSYTKLCTITNANTWTLLTIPNIPVFPPSGSWSVNPGVNGAVEGLCFGAGANMTSSSDGVWTNSGALASPGTDNWFSGVINTTQVEIGFIQHEPGGQSSTLIDVPFSQNYDLCLRYLQKSYDYGVAQATITPNGAVGLFEVATTFCSGPTRFYKPMAKTPTMIIFNPITGAANSVAAMTGSTNYTVSSVNGLGTSGFLGLVTSAMPAPVAGYGIEAHYWADTNW